MLTNYIRRLSVGIFIIIGALTLFCPILNAETENKEKEEDSLHHRMDSYIRYMPSRSVESMSGKVGIIKSDTEYSYEFKVFDKLPVKFSLDNEYIGIEDSVGVELPAHLIGLSTDIEATLPFFNFKETYLRFGLSPSFYGDDWDFRASSFRIPMRYLLIHRPNDRWTFVAGIGIYPDFENEIWPILGFIYKPNDKLTFNLVPKRPNITYLLNDRVALFAEGGLSSEEFEVTRNNSKNVVLLYKESRLASGIKYTFNPQIQASFCVGGVFGRSLKYRDNQGKVNIKNSLYSEFRIEIEL